jgi:hypothetical protein
MRASKKPNRMKGGLKQRYKGSWSIVLDVGYRPDPITGTLKRQQKWVTFRGTKKEALAKRTELLHTRNNGAFVEPSKLTLGAWVREWLDTSVKSRCRRQPTRGTGASSSETS